MCDRVKYNTDILKDLTSKMYPPMSFSILSAIKLRYNVIRYDVKHYKHLDPVNDWKYWSGGKIPAILVEGQGSVDKYVGVNSMEELARKCVKWFMAREEHRPNIMPSNTRIDMRQEG